MFFGHKYCIVHVRHCCTKPELPFIVTQISGTTFMDYAFKANASAQDQ